MSHGLNHVAQDAAETAQEMTFQGFLNRTASFSSTSVRAAMVQAIAEVVEYADGHRRPLDRTSYPRFYQAALRRLESSKPAAAWEGGTRSPVRGGRHAPNPEAPYSLRRLAARVIDQALRDMLNPRENTASRDSARRFLTGSPWLYYWCEVAGLDPGRVIKGAAALVSANGTPLDGMPRRFRPISPKKEA